MADHFNGLTPGEAERLAMLAEEAGEVVQAAMKVLRHGYESRHPDGGPTNRHALRLECIDLQNALDRMFGEKDLPPVCGTEIAASRARKVRFTHHQTPSKEDQG